MLATDRIQPRCDCKPAAIQQQCRGMQSPITLRALSLKELKAG
jgi:hypothetical protein